MREYKTIRALRRGEVIDIEGIKLKMMTGPDGQEEQIREGDIYVAERNQGPKLLTAKKLIMAKPCDCGDCENRHPGFNPTTIIDFIIPTCDAYPYDGNECVKVCEA